MTRVQCSACGGATRPGRDGLAVCSRCGSARVWPPPDPARVYTDDYFDGARDARGYFDANRVQTWKAATASLLLRRVLPHVSSRRPAVLDFGAGAGAMVRACRARGMAVAAVEPHARGRELIRAAGIEATADLGGIDASSRFDLILLMDVIEHVEEPADTVRQLAERLRQGGVVALTTPDYGGPWRTLLGSRWPHLKPREHLHYLTRAGARALVGRSGLELVGVRRHVKMIALDYLLRDQARRGGAAGALAGRVAPLAGFLVPVAFPAYLDEMLVIARARDGQPNSEHSSSRRAPKS